MTGRAVALAAAVLSVLACGQRPATDAKPPAARHLQVDGTLFRSADGSVFQWRGITAFRLLDHIADGREADADKYLAWAASQRLTVVRVLAMGGGFMDLRPPEGRAALPRLLEMAARHGIHVEIVGLAGTRDMPVSLEEQIDALGRVAGSHGNALFELANEPVHPTQAPQIHDPGVLRALASRVPSGVPVALGSVETGEGFAAGGYVTWHVPRDDRFDGWGHVLAIASGADLVRRWNKPVVSDEPIGAGSKYEPGRRDDRPARFRAAGLATRLAGMGATFHYEGGLQAVIPTGRELECFNAWNEAWTLLPANLEQRGSFRRAGEEGAAVTSFTRDNALAVFERQRGNQASVLVINPRADPALKWAPGWTPAETKRLDGAWVITARAASPEP